MANTTWSSTDKVNVTLSGTNSLTATTTAGSNNGVRTIDRQATGLFYFEYTLTTIGGTVVVGVANAGAVLGPTSNITVTPTNAAIVYTAGTIWVNNVNSGSTLGARANGDIIGVALNDTSKQIWFRVAPAGNWNGSGTANPATGVGGISVAPISPDSTLSPLYGCFATNGSGIVVTANFGDTAFSGAVPAGFTSGFTSGASPALVAAATSLAAEHWLTTSPNAQVTQVALEHWATVGSTGVQAVVTQIALEHWAVVVPPARGGPMVTMVM